jgi:formylglycine-generating enzyme
VSLLRTHQGAGHEQGSEGGGWVAAAVAILTVQAAGNVFNMPSGLTSLETVTVGTPGNAADTRYETPGYGSVGYTYNIGKYEVTAGQYTEFLNAVARTDTYGLYNPYMADPARMWGCNIQRSGPSGSYSYSVDPDWANRPVNYVSYGDSARFANWLHNGQPIGAQGLATTEDGAYYLNGATSDAALMAVNRKTGWK